MIRVSSQCSLKLINGLLQVSWTIVVVTQLLVMVALCRVSRLRLRQVELAGYSGG
jgi:hypothetical protein